MIMQEEPQCIIFECSKYYKFLELILLLSLSYASAGSFLLQDLWLPYWHRGPFG